MVPFILIVVGILLIVANLKLRQADKVNNEKTEKKEESFSEVFQEKHDNMSNEQLQIGEIRKDVAESLTELQREILDIKNSIKSIQNKHKYYDNKIKALQKTISNYEKKEKENENKRESQNRDPYDNIGEFGNQANERKYLLDIYKEDLNDTIGESESDKDVPSKVDVLKDEETIEASYEKVNDSNEEQVDEEIVHNEEEKNIEEEVNTIIPDKKAEKIKMLLEEGIEEKEICRILSVTNGEVELVKGLIKNEDAKKS